MSAPLVRLGEVCEIRNGATPKTGTEAYWGGEVKWITPAEMGGRGSPYVGCTTRTLTQVGLEACSATLAPPNSVILSSRAPIGYVVINTVPMATNQGCKTLIPTEDVHYKYLYHFLTANTELLNGLGTGATFPEISARALKQVEIPLPPVAEQKRISNHLDYAQSLVDSLLTNLAASSDLTHQVRNRLTELRAFEIDATKVVRLGDVLTVQNGFAFSSKNFTADGEVGLIRIRDLKNGEGTQTRYSGEYSPDYLVRAGDLLIGMDGKFRCYQWRGEPALLNQRVCRLIDFSENVVPKYLLFVLNEHLKQIEDVTGYATVKHLSSKTIKEIQLPLPSKSDQQRAVRKWSEAHERINRLQESFAQQSQLVQSFQTEIVRSAILGDA